MGAETRNLLDSCIEGARRLENSTMLGSAMSQLGYYYLRWDSLAESEQWFRKGEAILTDDDYAATFSLYCGMIVLFKAANKPDIVNNYYELAIELVKSQETVTDRDWQILLGYATWQVSQGDYATALHNIKEAFDNIKEIMYTRTFLKHDTIGPWHLMSLLISKIHHPDVEDSPILDLFYREIDEMKEYFPHINVEELPDKDSNEMPAEYVFPQLFKFSSLERMIS